MPSVTLTVTGPDTWTFPLDAEPGSLVIEVVGPGGLGAAGAASTGRAGGGGGAYSKSFGSRTAGVTPGTVLEYEPGQVTMDSGAIMLCYADPGVGGALNVGGSGGSSGSCVGDVMYSGGAGAAGNTTSGGGGGGSAGPAGAGSNGATGAAGGAGGPGNATGGQGGVSASHHGGLGGTPGAGGGGGWGSFGDSGGGAAGDSQITFAWTLAAGGDDTDYIGAITAPQIIQGQTKWEMSRDSEGHREYRVTHKVLANPKDGPANVLQCPGLPVPGSFWSFDNDSDLWATCRWDAKVTPVITDEPNMVWEVEQTFSSKAPDTKNCKTTQVEDPLLEPPKVSGSFVKYTEEAVLDRFGNFITNSAFEQMRGSQVEFDRNRPTIKIEQNVPTAYLAYQLPSQMVDTVNNDTLWGFPRRTIKLSSASWERKFQGECSVYYTRTLEFDINIHTDQITGEQSSGWDKELADIGHKVLCGHWSDAKDAWILDEPFTGAGSPDPQNPRHFIKFKDREGQPGEVVLDGAGKPAGVVVIGAPVTIIAETAILVAIYEYDPPIPAGTILVTTPTTPSALTIHIKDDDETLTGGYVEVSGTDPNAVAIDEIVEIGSGTADYYTSRIYATIGSVNLMILGDGSAGDTITVKTARTKSNPGSIHVEKYNEMNFLALNIPTSF